MKPLIILADAHCTECGMSREDIALEQHYDLLSAGIEPIYNPICCETADLPEITEEELANA